MALSRKFRSVVDGAEMLPLLTGLNKGIKPATINHELSVISAAVNHAVRKWGVNIANPVRYQWLKTGPLRLRYLEKHEAKTLLEQAHKLRPDLANFIRLAINTGCRKTELLLLKWSDVNIERRYMLLRPENTKGNKRRILPLNAGAIQALTQQKQQIKTEWVFARQNGERVKTFNWLFRKAAQQAGIEDFRIHDLRHTFASWLVSEGVELVKVRDLLGHSSIKMTERYAHLMPDRLLGAVSVLDLFETI
jgi:integrase